MTGSITLHEGDNRDHLRRLIAAGVRVHSVVCDPPYGLVSVTKRFGKEGAAPAKFGSDGAFQRAGAGFMGSKWDASGIERDPEFWRLVWEILLPGGYCLAFSSPRTGHWQACAMELAGFVMHPFLGWVYGQGFPKAHNAAMAIDKQLGVKGGRGAPKSAAHAGWIDRGTMRGDGSENEAGWQRPWMEDAGKVEDAARRYVPGSPEAAPWDGWSYGGQAIKPALEPIYVGQKPFSEKNGALNLLKHGVGAINIDGCRVPLNGDYKSQANGRPSLTGLGDNYDPAAANQADDVGRFPANLLHDGSADVVAMFPQTASGVMKGGTRRAAQDEAGSFCYGTYGGRATVQDTFGDSGSAARFFNAFPMTEADYDELASAGLVVDLEAAVIRYHPKATAADRVTQCLICGDRFVGSKPKCGCKEDGKAKVRSHPTVKPIELMRWLVRLVTPAGGLVLDPFGGSGTTGKAAIDQGYDCILMEADEHFAADIRARFGLPSPRPDLPADCLAMLGFEPANDPLDVMDLVG